MELRRLTLIFCIGGVGKSCLTGEITNTKIVFFFFSLLTYALLAQFVHNEWIESYDPTIEDSYRTQIQVDVSHQPGSI